MRLVDITLLCDIHWLSQVVTADPLIRRFTGYRRHPGTLHHLKKKIFRLVYRPTGKVFPYLLLNYRLPKFLLFSATYSFSFLTELMMEHCTLDLENETLRPLVNDLPAF